MSTAPKIAIIGAGPSGLTLARLLITHAKIHPTVYELDASPASRPDQGGTLDLHPFTGLAALRKCALWDSFQAHARYEGEEKTMADKNATTLVHIKSGNTRPEIDRQELKCMLLESLPPGCVKWGRKLKAVSEDGKLRFEVNGREEEVEEGPFDLVVGADGAWSKVRAKLTAVKPVYSGISGYEMTIRDPSRTCSHVDRMVGRGAYFGTSDRKFLNAQRMGDGSLKVRSWYACPEGEAKEALKQHGKDGALKQILRRYDGWAPEMTEFFKQADLESLREWTLYELPVGCKWEHQEGFTLIGDAASLMTPFSGEGVNKAMKDSLDLAELIENSLGSQGSFTLDEAVLQYEQKMFPRAEKLQRLTIANKQNAFGPDAPIGLMTGMIKTLASDEEASILVKVAGSAPVLAAVFSYFWIRQQIGWAVRTWWRRT